jgi:hypothetical protein
MLARQDQEITAPLLTQLQNFARVGSIPSEIEIMHTQSAPPALGVAVMTRVLFVDDEPNVLSVFGGCCARWIRAGSCDSVAAPRRR